MVINKATISPMRALKFPLSSRCVMGLSSFIRAIANRQSSPYCLTNASTKYIKVRYGLKKVYWKLPSAISATRKADLYCVRSREQAFV